MCDYREVRGVHEIIVGKGHGKVICETKHRRTAQYLSLLRKNLCVMIM
jgi:hypothetical protein